MLPRFAVNSSHIGGRNSQFLRGFQAHWTDILDLDISLSSFCRFLAFLNTIFALRRRPYLPFLHFMPTSDSWKGGSCFRERNPRERPHTKIEMELARKRRSTTIVESNFTLTTSGPMAIVAELEDSICERYHPNLSKAQNIVFSEATPWKNSRLHS